jgi:GGDEF domain-containing protein
MIEKKSNLAVVTNHTLEASKSVSLYHYDIHSALQTTLKFEELIPIFSQKIQHLIPHDAYQYINDEFDKHIENGVKSKHNCTYTLKYQEQQLGILKLLRNKRFDEAELKLLETLICCLIYPLKNATLYNQALTMAYTDPLTKTNNRTAFEDSVKREITLANRKSRNLSLIFLDIDHF